KYVPAGISVSPAPFTRVCSDEVLSVPNHHGSPVWLTPVGVPAIVSSVALCTLAAVVVNGWLPREKRPAGIVPSMPATPSVLPTPPAVNAPAAELEHRPAVPQDE